MKFVCECVFVCVCVCISFPVGVEALVSVGE
jgi:hypothetical protein